MAHYQAGNQWMYPDDIPRVLMPHFTSVFTQEYEDDGVGLRELDCGDLQQIAEGWTSYWRRWPL